MATQVIADRFDDGNLIKNYLVEDVLVCSPGKALDEATAILLESNLSRYFARSQPYSLVLDLSQAVPLSPAAIAVLQRLGQQLHSKGYLLFLVNLSSSDASLLRHADPTGSLATAATVQDAVSHLSDARLQGTLLPEDVREIDEEGISLADVIESLETAGE